MEAAPSGCWSNGFTVFEPCGNGKDGKGCSGMVIFRWIGRDDEIYPEGERCKGCGSTRVVRDAWRMFYAAPASNHGAAIARLRVELGISEREAYRMVCLAFAKQDSLKTSKGA